jgi:hypothetical protein
MSLLIYIIIVFIAAAKLTAAGIKYSILSSVENSYFNHKEPKGNSLISLRLNILDNNGILYDEER